jgi:hypothetical protein
MFVKVCVEMEERFVQLLIRKGSLHDSYWAVQSLPADSEHAARVAKGNATNTNVATMIATRSEE